MSILPCGGPTQPDMTQLVRLTTIAVKNADQKPVTTKPERKYETSSIISPLMTRRKSPSVKIVIGKVMMTNRPHERVDDAEQQRRRD